MNWHLRSPSQVWVLEESDYLIYMGRKYWNRRNEDGEYTSGPLRSTQPARKVPAPDSDSAQAMRERRKAIVRGKAVELVKSGRFDPRESGDIGHEDLSRLVIDHIATDRGVRMHEDVTYTEARGSSKFSTQAKAGTSEALGRLAAEDPAAKRAHAAYLERLGLNVPRKDLALFDPLFESFSAGRMPALFHSVPGPQRVDMTPGMKELLRKRTERIRLNDQEEEYVRSTSYATTLVRLDPVINDTSQNVVSLRSMSDEDKERLSDTIARAEDRLDDLVEFRDLVRALDPAAPDFAERFDALAVEYEMSMRDIGTSMPEMHERARTVIAAQELMLDPRFFMEGVSAQVVDDWAGSSWGATSMVMQHLVGQEFGLRAEWVNEDADDFDEVIERLEDDPDVKGAYRAVALAMYSTTQAMLEEAGIDQITLYRGLKDHMGEGDRLFESGQATVDMAPLSSWTSDPRTAHDFAGGDVPGHMNVTRGHILVATVPRERVISLAYGGVGCLSESEVVVIGGDMEVESIDLMENAVRINRDGTITTAPAPQWGRQGMRRSAVGTLAMYKSSPSVIGSAAKKALEKAAEDTKAEGS